MNELNSSSPTAAGSGTPRRSKSKCVRLGPAGGPGSQDDEELKLMALRGSCSAIRSRRCRAREDADRQQFAEGQGPRAVPAQPEPLGARATSSPGRHGHANPDLQLRAIRYLGIMGGPDNRQILSDVYKTSNDPAVKRSIPRSFMIPPATRIGCSLRPRSETDAQPARRGDSPARRDARQQRAGAAVPDRNVGRGEEVDPPVHVRRRRQRQADRAGQEREGSRAAEDGDSQPRVDEAARHDRGADRRSTHRTPRLTSRRRSINALFLQSNATGLVSLARAEKNVDLKKEIVSKLSVMKSKEATDYLMELLK